MAFFGRKVELDILKDTLSASTYQGVLVWGRRHVGKSALIGEALKTFKGLILYYQCLQADDATNLRDLAKAYALVSKHPFDKGISFPDLDAFFSFVLEREKDQPLVIVLDEYPYWREGSLLGKEGCDSAFQRVIDRQLAPAGCKLIVSGSYLGVMEEIQKEGNPLAGRFKNKISLSPLNYREAAGFYPDYSPLEKIKAYAAFGGMPYLLEEINPNQSVDENLAALYFSPAGKLRKLTPLLADEELSKKAILCQVFSLLSERKDRPSLADIASCFQTLSKEWIRKALFELTDMQLVERVYPIDAEGNERNAYYRIADNGLAYYFRCVRPYEGAIALSIGPSVFSQAQILFSESLLPTAFEKIAATYLVLSNPKRQELPFLAIGTYFYNTKGHNGQFDVVGKNAKGYVFFECKLHSLTPADLKEEQTQIAALPSYAIHPYALGFFGLSKGTLKDGNNPFIYDAADLYR
jgi:uncharacterized protein